MWTSMNEEIEELKHQIITIAKLYHTLIEEISYSKKPKPIIGGFVGENIEDEYKSGKR